MTGFSSSQLWSVSRHAIDSRLTRQKTTDKDDEVTLNGDSLRSLGKIRVDIFRGTKGAYTGGQHACLIAPDVGVAAEKSKKCVEHCQLYGIMLTSKARGRNRVSRQCLARYHQLKLSRFGEKSAYRPINTVLWHPHDDDKVPFHRLELNVRLTPSCVS